MSFENFPYSNFHELNLDWILKELKEKYSAENPPDYPVKSVNGMTGDVIIAIPSNFVQSVNGETGDVVLYRNPLTQFPATDETRWNLFRICDGTETGIQFDENGASRIEGIRRIRIYDEDNPPDYPVTSVNGQTGDVQITAGVQSVNGKTGNVVTPFVNPNTDILAIDTDSPSILWGFSRNVAGGNVALYITTGGINPQAFIRFTPTEGDAINLPLLTNADIPSSAGVVSINGKTGAVTLYGTDILISSDSTLNIKEAIDNITTLINNLETKTNSDIDVINNTIFTITTGNPEDWVRGAYNPANGEIAAAQRYLRLINYLPQTYSVVRSINNNIGFFVDAWNENDEFVGLYNSETNSFAPSETHAEKLLLQEINLAKIWKDFPNYKLKLELRYIVIGNITESEARNIAFYIYSAGGTVETHTQQISALQESDTNQSQQITSLQNTDATHTQQITSLQNTDATHTQQISALQTAIENIQSGAGIKEVKLSEVITLPARYPATGTDADIKTNMDCVNAILSRPGVQRTNFTVEFFEGYLTISGTMQGLTDITLYLTEV